jgi:hypothetical protein
MPAASPTIARLFTFKILAMLNPNPMNRGSITMFLARAKRVPKEMRSFHRLTAVPCQKHKYLQYHFASRRPIAASVANQTSVSEGLVLADVLHDSEVSIGKVLACESRFWNNCQISKASRRVECGTPAITPEPNFLNVKIQAWSRKKLVRPA